LFLYFNQRSIDLPKSEDFNPVLKYLFRQMADNLTEVITPPEQLYYSNSKPCPAAHSLNTITNQSFNGSEIIIIFLCLERNQEIAGIDQALPFISLTIHTE
jgi:hypothetical protein